MVATRRKPGAAVMTSAPAPAFSARVRVRPGSSTLCSHTHTTPQCIVYCHRATASATAWATTAHEFKHGSEHGHAPERLLLLPSRASLGVLFLLVRQFSPVQALQHSVFSQVELIYEDDVALPHGSHQRPVRPLERGTCTGCCLCHRSCQLPQPAVLTC